MEKVNIRSLRSNAKIIGTVISVSGAMSMALLKGPKLLNAGIVAIKSSSGSSGETWLLGSLILFGNSCCWAIWTVMQVFPPYVIFICLSGINEITNPTPSTEILDRSQYQQDVLIPYSLLLGCVSLDPYRQQQLPSS